MAETVIEVKNATVTFSKGFDALSDVSVSLSKGNIIGLLGPSGAGKTTLIRAILGLQKLSKGSITVLGQPAGERKLHAEIGYSTQMPAVYPDLTVEQNMTYFASLLGVGDEEVAEILRDVEIDRLRSRLALNLSGGEIARLSLSVALLGKPPLLLLDEPTVGLDPVLRAKLWRYFRTLTQNGTIIVLTSHVMDEAEKCDEIVFIRNGQLLIAGDKDKVYQSTNTDNMEEAFLSLAKGRAQ